MSAKQNFTLPYCIFHKLRNAMVKGQESVPKVTISAGKYGYFQWERLALARDQYIMFL